MHTFLGRNTMATNTKYTIIEAYISLISKKGMDKVTVKDVVESCGITRQTFYYHFQDLLDVIEWGFRKRTDESIRRGLEAASIEEALVIFFSAANDYRPLAKKILTSQKKNQISDLVMNGIQNWLFLMFKEKNSHIDYPVHELDFALQFYAYAIAGSLYDVIWNDEADIHYTAKQIVHLMQPVLSMVQQA